MIPIWIFGVSLLVVAGVGIELGTRWERRFPAAPKRLVRPPGPAFVALEQLSAMPCAIPGCDRGAGHREHPRAFLHAPCHVRSDTSVRFNRDQACLELNCGECGITFARVAL